MRPGWSNPFAEWNRNFALLVAASSSVGLFFGVQMTLYNNYLVERLGIEPHQLGYVEALREMPGFLNALFIALMIRLAPPLVAGLALMVMGVGLMAFAGVSSIASLAFYSVVWSLGLHCWMPLEQAMCLSYSPPGNKGRWLGYLRSAGSAAWLVAIVGCYAALDLLHYEGMFILGGAAAVLGGVAILFAGHQRDAIREPAWVFRRRYGLFYLLNFLQGCRKQVFITFAFFALVKIHHMPVQTAILLSLINQVLVALTGSTMGRMVDRLGERFTLSLSHFVLIFVFLGYALVEHRPTLYALFCLDNLIFFGAIALTTYLHKIAPEEDLKPTLSMGVTMNHAAAVLAPLVGGVAWHLFGYRVIFVSGAAISLLSLAVSLRVNPEGQRAREQQELVAVPVLGSAT
jgi:predicted MFS family arabinose efflux permease